MMVLEKVETDVRVQSLMKHAFLFAAILGVATVARPVVGVAFDATEPMPGAWAMPAWVSLAPPAGIAAPTTADGIADLIARYVTGPDRPVAGALRPKVARSAGSPSNQTGADGGPGARTITIVVTGDTGFSRNHSPVHPKGVLKYGRRQPWREATAAIAGEINGDINFTNIETVVTARNDLRRDTKGQKGPFNFRTHPNAVRHIVKRGFNVFSLANNHSMDYGVAGLKETLANVRPLVGKGLLAYAGIGMNREEASRPKVFAIKGADIAYASIGIVTNNLARHRAGPNKPGQIAYRFDADFDLSTKRLAAAPAALRMLSIHYGIEGRVRADARQIKEWRDFAARKRGIDLVIGHHAHVVRAVERVGDKIIFYGLGNFLHHGTANMAGKGICKDYGLLARIHLVRDRNGQIRPRAIEAVPLTKMHIRTDRMGPRAARARIHALNYLAAHLPAGPAGTEGIRFTPQPDGSGLYCFAGASREPGAIGRLCGSWRPAPAIPAGLRGRIARSCAR